MNAYQQQYPPFPELAQAKKSVSHMQCQTDSLTMAALSDNLETRIKLRMALEQLGDCTDNQAEMIAAEERETALKMLADQEATKSEISKPASIKQWRPLHLPIGNVRDEAKSKAAERQSHEALLQVKEHVVQRDSVTRLRSMLNHSHCEAGGWPNESTDESLAQTSARKLPKRVFGSLREPPKIIPQAPDSLISLAEKLRYLDVAGAGWASENAFLDSTDESTRMSLHQKLKQLPTAATVEKQQAAEIGTAYSLSYTLQSWQRYGGGL